MAAFIIFALIVLVFIAIYQIAKAAETASILRGNEREQYFRTNKIMAWLLLITFILGMYGIYKCHVALIDKMLPVPASDHGVKYEEMFKVTLILTGIVFFLTQALLFFFILKYKDTGKHKSSYMPHNNMLELVWTVIPTIFLVILVVIGLRNWITMTGEAPKDKLVVEIVGRQFNFIIRYPGPDGQFGKTDFRKINDENNILGLDWNDPFSKDDIIIQNSEMHIISGKPVQLVIKSRDVLHDIGLPHFRMKMDAVPGIITTMWFTPLYTTKEMQEITKNPEFVYEINCAEMCGKGHFSMRGTVVVSTQAEFDDWIKGQPSYFSSIQPAQEAAPAPEGTPAPQSPAPVDSNATATPQAKVAAN